MSNQDIFIAIILNFFTGVITFWLTKDITTKKDKEVFKREQKESRESTADAAFGHLRSSYLAVKKLELGVLSKARQYEGKEENFHTILWGIHQSLEQIRLGLQGHMNAWKGDLKSNSDFYMELQKFKQEDVFLDVVSRSVANVSFAENPAIPSVKQMSEAAAFSSSGSPAMQGSSSLDGFESFLSDLARDPGERAIERIQAGRLDEAGQDLKAIVAQKGSINAIIAIGCMLAIAGNRDGNDALQHAFKHRYNELDDSSRTAAFMASVTYMIRNPTHLDALLAESLGARIISEGHLDDSDRARIQNQIAKAFYANEKYDKAAEWQEKAAALIPGNHSYHYNLALCFKELGDMDGAALRFKRILDMGTTDPDHLFAAAVFFAGQGDFALAGSIVVKLNAVDRLKASMAKSVLDEEVKRKGKGSV